jgi:hypothetical protein
LKQLPDTYFGIQIQQQLEKAPFHPQIRRSLKTDSSPIQGTDNLIKITIKIENHLKRLLMLLN